jgi:hypothetical protein
MQTLPALNKVFLGGKTLILPYKRATLQIPRRILQMTGVSNHRTDHWTVRFYTLWIGQAFSLFGSQLVQFSIGQVTFWQDFVTRFRYIIAWRGLVILLGLVMVINSFTVQPNP